MLVRKFRGGNQYLGHAQRVNAKIAEKKEMEIKLICT